MKRVYCGIHFTVLLLLLIGFCGVAGCSYRSTAHVTPGFHNYKKVAIIPRLPRQSEDLFLPLYMSAFPGQIIVERRDIFAAIGEQDLLPGRLNEATRARIKKLFGVEAIVFPTYEGGIPNSVSIKVIDTETGVITASATARGNDYWTGEGAQEESLVKETVKAFQKAAAKSK